MNVAMQSLPLRAKVAIVTIMLLAVPIVANAVPLFGILDSNSALRSSGLQTNVVPGFLSGLPQIDPSGGTTYEPEAHEALRQWLAGEIPWWNHFEGVGFPLAGSIVPGAFSPFLLLLALPNGAILQPILAQILCGLFTYKALRLIGCSRFAALVGGAMYELNGTFAWLGSVWSMPTVALPLWTCGVELVRRADRRGAWIGVACIAIATYLAITSSFIETGFLEGLFIIAWFVARLTTTTARMSLRLAALCVVGGAIGLMLAGPQIVAFADVLKYGVSIHQDGSIGLRSIVTEGVPQFFLPYVWGPIFKYNTPAIIRIWGNIGGYAGTATLVVASAAFSAKRARSLIVMLTAWIALAVGAQFGAPFFPQFINLIPGVKFTAQYRYLPPTWEFAMVVLCCLLITEWQEDRRLFLRPAHRIALASLAVTLSGFMYLHGRTIDELLLQQDYSRWLLFSLIAGFLVAGFAVVCMNRPGPASLRILGVVLVGEALLYYVLPTLAYPRSGSIDNGYVQAFHARAGYSRLYSINALQPDYGSLYQIPQINYSDVVIPKNYVDFLRRLDPYQTEAVLYLPYRLRPSADEPTLAEIVAWRRCQFESLGVKYVDAARDQLLPSFSPPISGGSRSFVLGKTELAGAFGGLLHDEEITSVGFSVFGAELPDGAVSAQICSGPNCVLGKATLDKRSPEVQALEIRFAKALPVVNGRVSFKIVQRHYQRPAEMRLYLRGSIDESVIGQPRLFPSLQFRTRLTTYKVPTGPPANQSLDLAESSVHATIATPSIGIGGSIVSVAILEGSHDGKIRLRICSIDCVYAENALPRNAADAYVEIPLSKPLKIETKQVTAEFAEVGPQLNESLALYSEMPSFAQQISYGGRLLPGLALKVKFAINSALPKEVYRSSSTSLFELPSPEGYFTADKCRLKSSSRDALVANCRQASTLVRRELYYPGWVATVNGTDATIRSHDQILEEVALPKGESIVRFYYEPRYAPLALILSGFALIFLMVCIALGLRSAHGLVSATNL